MLASCFLRKSLKLGGEDLEGLRGQEEYDQNIFKVKICFEYFLKKKTMYQYMI